MHWLSSPTLAVCTFESVPCNCTLMSCNALVHCPSDPAVALTLALHWSTAPPLRPAQGTRTGKLAARIGWNRPDAKLWLPSGVKQGVQRCPPSGALYNGTLLLWSLPCPSRPFYYHISSLQTGNGCRSTTIQLIRVDWGKTKYFISSYILSAAQVENGTKFLSPRQKNFDWQIKYSLRLRHHTPLSMQISIDFQN